MASHALDDDVIRVITERLPDKASPLSVLLFYRLDGAFGEVGDDDTAFSGTRTPRYSVFVVGVCPDAETLVGERAWVQGLYQALRPLSLDGGADANHLMGDDQVQLRASYGDAKLERLAAVKGRYDPGNVFRRTLNIKPS